MTVILTAVGVAAFVVIGWFCARGFGQCADEMGGPDDE